MVQITNEPAWKRDYLGNNWEAENGRMIQKYRLCMLHRRILRIHITIVTAYIDSSKHNRHEMYSRRSIVQ